MTALRLAMSGPGEDEESASALTAAEHGESGLLPCWQGETNELALSPGSSTTSAASPSSSASSSPRLRRRLAAAAAAAAGLAIVALAGSSVGAAPVPLASGAGSGGGAEGVGAAPVGRSGAGGWREAVTQLVEWNIIPQAPIEDRSDGNRCADDEEELNGLCYSPCTFLTHGMFPHRQSAWTCCRSESCTNAFSNCCRHNFGWCDGYDIAGIKEGPGICPHKLGACLQDEELFLNVCYMKCSLLTKGVFPYRIGSASCCKRKDLSCMVEEGYSGNLEGESITNASLSVGGGCHDAKSKTPCVPHAPQQWVTESK